MTDLDHNPTFADVLSLRDQMQRASDRADESGDESAFDRLADAKADAIDAVLDHGSDQDTFAPIGHSSPS